MALCPRCEKLRRLEVGDEIHEAGSLPIVVLKVGPRGYLPHPQGAAPYWANVPFLIEYFHGAKLVKGRNRPVDFCKDCKLKWRDLHSGDTLVMDGQTYPFYGVVGHGVSVGWMGMRKRATWFNLSEFEKTFHTATVRKKG